MCLRLCCEIKWCDICIAGGTAGAAAGVVLDGKALLGLYVGVLLILGLVNTVTVKALGMVGELSSE